MINKKDIQALFNLMGDLEKVKTDLLAVLVLNDLDCNEVKQSIGEIARISKQINEDIEYLRLDI